MVVGEEQQHLEAHATEKSYQHARAPARRPPTAENRASALAGVARTAVAAVAAVATAEAGGAAGARGAGG